MKSRAEINRLRGMDPDITVTKSTMSEEEAKKLHEESLDRAINALCKGIESLNEDEEVDEVPRDG